MPLSDETVEQVTLCMWGVVNEAGGTGGRARIDGVDVSGKTGSAQVASLGLTKGTHDKDLKDNGWFVGVAPRRNPEIAVAALFEHGEHGALAAPIVREVIKAYWDKRGRFNRLEQARLGANKQDAQPRQLAGTDEPAGVEVPR